MYFFHTFIHDMNVHHILCIQLHTPLQTKGSSPVPDSQNQRHKQHQRHQKCFSSGSCFLIHSKTTLSRTTLSRKTPPQYPTRVQPNTRCIVLSQRYNFVHRYITQNQLKMFTTEPIVIQLPQTPQQNLPSRASRPRTVPISEKNTKKQKELVLQCTVFDGFSTYTNKLSKPSLLGYNASRGDVSNARS